MATSSGLRLLVIQPTALCNLDCRYCYVPDRLDSSRLPLPFLSKLLRLVNGAAFTANQKDLKILWHAGEPLAAGVEYFREALDLVDQEVGDRFDITHSIQTNGTLLNDRWCEIIAERNIHVGVSLDGPEELNDSMRTDRNGRGSFQRVMRGIDVLRAHGVPINILLVLHAKNIRHPASLFHFLVENQLTEVAFNVEEIEGPNTTTSLIASSSDRIQGYEAARLAYREFMTVFGQLNSDRGWPLTIREFRSLSQKIISRRQGVPVVDEQRVGAIITMTRTGDLYSWSPELASGSGAAENRHSEPNVLGNVQFATSIDELLRSPRAMAIQEQIDLGVASCRTSCQYFSVCGGGSPGNKFYENGSFASTETIKCTLQTKELTNVLRGLLAKQPEGINTSR